MYLTQFCTLHLGVSMGRIGWSSILLKTEPEPSQIGWFRSFWTLSPPSLIPPPQFWFRRTRKIMPKQYEPASFWFVWTRFNDWRVKRHIFRPVHTWGLCGCVKMNKRLSFKLDNDDGEGGQEKAKKDWGDDMENKRRANDEDWLRLRWGLIWGEEMVNPKKNPKIKKSSNWQVGSSSSSWQKFSTRYSIPQWSGWDFFYQTQLVNPTQTTPIRPTAQLYLHSF